MIRLKIGGRGMSFTPNYQELKSSYIRKIGTTQSTVECKLPASDNTNIVKVVCASAKCVPAEANFQDKNLCFSGYVNFQVIYESDDNATYSMDYTVEYKDEYGVDNHAFFPQIDCSVADVTTAVNGNEIKVLATIETTINGVFDESTNALVSVEDETSFMQSVDVQYSTFEGAMNTSFAINHDFEIKDEVSRILSVCPMASLNKVEVHDGFVKVSGGVLVDINYFTLGENAKVRTYQDYITFEEEVARDTLKADDNVLSSLYVGINEIGITTTIDNDKTMVGLSLPIVYNGLVFSHHETSVTQDVFSTTNALLTTTASVTTATGFNTETFMERIDGSIKLENMPFIDEILGTCCNNLTLVSAYVEQGELTVQGIAYVTVLYYSKEENITSSVVVEIPFSLSNPTDQVSGTPMVELALADLSVKGKRGEEIEVYGKINVFANFYDNDSFAVLSNVEVGEEYSNHGYALSVYFVKNGETLWEIARNMHVSPDQILEQNPNVELPLKAGDKLYIYRQRNFSLN